MADEVKEEKAKPAKSAKQTKSVAKVTKSEAVTPEVMPPVRKSSKQYKELTKIEEQLVGIFIEEQKIWVRTYKLMQDVKEKKLYTAKGYKSFSAWMNSLSTEILHVHVSLLWKRMKAGNLYAGHVARLAAAGTNGAEVDADAVAAKLAETEVSPDTLVLIDKVASGNAKQVDELIAQAEAGTLTNKDLKEAWTVAKAKKQEAGQGLRKNGRAAKASSDSADPAGGSDADADAGVAAKKEQAAADALAAAQIAHALSDSAWLRTLYNYDADPRKFDKPTFKLLTEFPVYTAETRNPRRIDALICENFSVDSHTQDEVKLHAIEIKVSKSDLERDAKMGDYALYADKFWLAIPSGNQELTEAAKGYLGDKWGLLIVEKNVGEDGIPTYSINVEKQAEQGEPQFKERALMSLARRLIN